MLNDTMTRRNDGNDTKSRSNEIGSSAIMMFTSSLVKHAASPQLRLPANFVGVQVVRQEIRKELPSEEKKFQLKAANDVKFCVVDENGNERRMTKAEKKAKKILIAQAKKEAKKAAANKKRNFEQITKDDKESNATTDTSDQYHQLPLDQTTMEQELAEGKRGSTPPVILSPPMATQFLRKEINLPVDTSALLNYDHQLSQEWANRLKQLCVLPAEALRQKEDLRPLAYRLQPEPWQRLRPTLDESPLVTAKRTNAQVKQTMPDLVPKPCEWIPVTCRPRLTGSQQTQNLQHDDILSIVFEYIYRETPYYVSCGAKFGSDFLVYDGPRDQRHAFAGLRVLSRFTNSMSNIASTQNQVNTVELPLPTAYSLTGFVRCLNTAGKLALLATVDKATDDSDDSNIEIGKHRYRVAFVDVALEKVMDVHRKKNNRGNKKKKLQKRRDVTQTLSKN